MRTQSGRATRRLAVSAMLAALGVVLLWLGALVEVLDLSVAVLASMLAVFAVIEMGRRYAVLVYVVTALLSLLLLPVKTSALVYAVFAACAIFGRGLLFQPNGWIWEARPNAAAPAPELGGSKAKAQPKADAESEAADEASETSEAVPTEPEAETETPAEAAPTREAPKPNPIRRRR